jgi:hypothetical protein
MDTTYPPSGPDAPGSVTAQCASADVAGMLRQIQQVAHTTLPTMGLADGLRPAADVDALASAVAMVEFELARRMHAAARSGALPLTGDGAMLMARRWSARRARQMARAGAFAARHGGIAVMWSAGVITTEHVDALAQRADKLSDAEMDAVVEQLAGRWGALSPEQVGRFLQRVIRVLHPPPDPDPDEGDAYAERALSFSVMGDVVLLAGCLPRLEGEAVMNAVDAMAEQLRSAADHVPPAARRADGLVALISAAASSVPSRGGLPVSLSVRLEHTSVGDPLWTTSHGHELTGAEQRFTACSADVTPILVDGDGCRRGGLGAGQWPEPGHFAGVASPAGAQVTPTASPAAAAATPARIAALASTLLDSCVPLALGRTQRSASPGQRRALALRDKGCVIPACRVPAEACQSHHVREWSADGSTDLDNLVLLCWAHHRQVDLGMWSLEPADPDRPLTTPPDGSPSGTRWPANNGSPWIVTVTPRGRWRL